MSEIKKNANKKRTRLNIVLLIDYANNVESRFYFFLLCMRLALITFPPMRVRSIAINASVCRYVCLSV